MNKVLLLGRLTDNIEPRYTQSNKLVTSFTVAVNRAKADANGQEADFIRCEAWEKTAEILLNYFGKGSRISLEGRIKTGSYDDPNNAGKKVYTTDVVVERIHFVDTLAESQARQQQQGYNNYQQPQTQPYAQPGYNQNNYGQQPQQNYYGNPQPAPQANNYGQPAQSYEQPNYPSQAQPQPQQQSNYNQQPQSTEPILDIASDDLPF